MSDFKAEMHQIRLPLGLRPIPRWGAYIAHPDPIAICWGPTSKGKKREGEREEGKGRGREEEGKENEGGCRKFLATPLKVRNGRNARTEAASILASRQ